MRLLPLSATLASVFEAEQYVSCGFSSDLAPRFLNDDATLSPSREREITDPYVLCVCKRLIVAITNKTARLQEYLTSQIALLVTPLIVFTFPLPLLHLKVTICQATICYFLSFSKGSIISYFFLCPINSNVPVRSLSKSIVTRGYVAADQAKSGKWALSARVPRARHSLLRPDRQKVSVRSTRYLCVSV